MQPKSNKTYKAIINRSKKEIDSNKIIVGHFNTPLTPMDKPSRQSQQENIGLK